MIEIKVPTVGESINEVTLLKWTKKDGEWVERDEVIAELESEKATFEVNAEKAGILTTIGKEGDTLNIGDVLANIDETAAKPEGVPAPAAALAPTPAAPVNQAAVTAVSNDIKASPVASAIIADKKVDTKSITPSGTGGKIMKQDVLDALNNPGKKSFAADGALFSRNVRQEKMSALRRTISRRLVESKNTTAMLTTFNEVDMTQIMEIRKQYKDKFKEGHGVNLGFMSFFAKACAIALGEWPSVNAYIDGDQII
ncbi:MAG: 2-oxo acid dehydrogenase subunit E2, partial [Sediminibacterium sp.]|nr:2-oxo acid dehydrogenase subunit E2 [Sediminibacterium sp.]